MKIKQAKGMSLVEIMIVVCIIAILAAIGILQFSRYQYNNALQSAARELAGDIQMLRQQATTNYDSTNPGLLYTLQFLDNTHYRYTYQLSPNQQVTRDVTTFSWDIAFDQSQNTFQSSQITFQPRGSINLGTVVLANSRGSQVKLTASPPLGRINVTYNMQ